jgi:hypothetical protein
MARTDSPQRKRGRLFKMALVPLPAILLMALAWAFHGRSSTVMRRIDGSGSERSGCRATVFGHLIRLGRVQINRSV